MHRAVRVLILYETRRGFTLTVARAIRDEIRGRGHLATTAPIRGVDPGTLAAADALVVGSWTKGLLVVKVGPAEGAIEGIAALPDLDGLPAAVFCTCDVAPRGTLGILASRLRRRGARVLVEHAFRRRKSLRQVPAFVDLVLDEVTAAHAAAPTTPDVPLAPAPGTG
jgi:flavodoxin